MNLKKKRQYVFFDLGWTLEDETEAQIDRAEKAAAAARDLGVQTTADRILQLQDEGAESKVHEVFPCSVSQLGLDERQQKVVLRKASWDKTHLSLYPVGNDDDNLYILSTDL